MEFHEKLQTLRKEKNLTQEELAQILFVSRTAISKWESGRGYPNLESLKAIATFFSVSIDELVRPEYILTIAEKDKKESIQENVLLVCGAMDLLIGVLLFLPVFGMRGGDAVSFSVFALSEISFWERCLFQGIIAITALNGACGISLLHFHKALWNKRSVVTGIGLSVVGSITFIAARQPYAALLFFVLLMLKGFLLFNAK